MDEQEHLHAGNGFASPATATSYVLAVSGTLLALVAGMETSTARPFPADPRGSVLIVDDELPLVDAISRYLGRQGYDVRTALNGRDALAHLSAAPADVMLCDVGLPDMEAPDLLTAARHVVPEMVVLMFSGWHDPRVADRLLAAGASAYVTKPMPLGELRDIVNQAVTARRAAPHLNRESDR